MSAPDLHGAADRRRRRQRRGRPGPPALLAANGSIDDQPGASPTTSPTPAAAVEMARSVLDYGAQGRRRGAHHVRVRRRRGARPRDAGARPRAAQWGVEPDALRSRSAFVATYRDPAFLAALAGEEGPRHLDADFELVQRRFRRFADDKVRPVAEHVHRTNADIPEDVISGLAEIGDFGLSVPEEYGGFADGRRERLPGHGRRHRGAVAGLARRRRFAHHPARDPHPRPRQGRHRGAEARVAAEASRSARSMVGGRRHRARLRLRRRRHQGHRHARPDDGWVINGVKTWCTFAARADVLMLLARTDPDRSKAHRGLVAVHRPQAARRGPRLRVRRRSRGGQASKGAPSTPSATAACTPTRSRSTTGSCRPRTSSAATRASAAASTCRWRASRTDACRPRPARSA